MILQALYGLAEKEGLVSEPDYEPKPIAWLVRVDDDGRILGLESTQHEELDPAGRRRKPKRIPAVFSVPREPGRARGDYAFFLVDKAEYVFGLDPTGKREPEALRRRSALFREKVEPCLAATGDEGVWAVHRALEQVAEGRQTVSLPEDCKGNDLFTFIYAPDVDQLVLDRPAVRAYWKQVRTERGSQGEKTDHCLVSGVPCAPVKKLPLIKGMPGGSTSGVSLVSFNSNAFESYWLKRNENAPVSNEAAEACGTALNRLLDPAWPHPQRPGEVLPRRHLRLSGNTVVCYWTAGGGDEFADSLAGIMEANEEQVAALYRSVWRGRAASMKDPSAFYALVLSGAQGRATVQQWIESTVQTAQHNLARHFADTAIARNCAPPKGRAWPPAFSLSALLEAIAVQGKRDNVPGPLVGRLIEAVFNRQRYPLALLQRALLRARAEAGLDDWPADTRRDARAALIKGILRRNFSKEVHETMDRDEKDEGYLFGRLMALIECMQQTALGSVNATVVDRFFGSASATPAAVFPRLLKNFRHHAAKAKAEGRTRGRAIYIENALDEIAHDLDAFPSHLDLQQQGLFVLGYHHQRYELWHKRDKAAQEQESEATQTATD